MNLPLETRVFLDDDLPLANMPRQTAGQTFFVAADDAEPRSRLKADYVCDGTADDVEIQAAIDALPSGNGTVRLSEGTFHIAQNIEFDALEGIEFVGSGMRSTSIRPATGLSAFNCLRVFGTRRSYFAHFTILSSAATPFDAAIVCETKTGVNITANTFEHIFIEGTATTGLDYGVRMITGTGGNANNELHTFKNIQVNNYDLRAFSIEHSQSKAHLFENCTGAPNAAGGNYGVFSESSYTWIGGSFGSHDTAIFFQSNANDYVNIIGAQAEMNSGEKFFDTGGPAANQFPCVIMGCRIEYTSSGGQPSDDIVVRHQYRGGFSFISNQIVATDHDSLEVNAGISSSLGYAFAAGNVIKTTLGNPFTGGPWVQSGNSVMDATNAVSSGVVLENSGTATVVSGNTSIAVTHGLSVTPTVDDISIAFNEQGTNDYGRWWVDTITSTQFTLNVSADPGASNLTFGWRARVL